MQVPSPTNSVPWDKVHWPKPFLITGPGTVLLIPEQWASSVPCQCAELFRQVSDTPLQKPGVTSPSCFYGACVPQTLLIHSVSGGSPQAVLHGVHVFPEAVSVWGCKIAVHLICPVSGVMYPTIPVTLRQESFPHQWSEGKQIKHRGLIKQRTRHPKAKRLYSHYKSCKIPESKSCSVVSDSL